MSAYAIRTMTRPEADFAVDLAADEGWNPGLHDAECFFRADPNGFLVGLLDGRPISCISAVSYGNGFGFMGFYIVVPEFRGRGYGMEIFKAGLKRLDGHNIGGDGVRAQIPNYLKIGFKAAYSNIRYEGAGGGPMPAEQALRPVGEVPFEALAAYDAALFPAERRAFLQAWLTMPDAHGLAWMDDGGLAGYGVVRQCRRGWKIGPLFADRPDVAETLYGGLCARVGEGEAVFLDVPEPNPEAMALADRRHLRPVFETTRIYTRGAPPIPRGRVFGVTSFELG